MTRIHYVTNLTCDLFHWGIWLHGFNFVNFVKFEVPRHIKNACCLDNVAGNNWWEVADQMEQDQLLGYSSFY